MRLNFRIRFLAVLLVIASLLPLAVACKSEPSYTVEFNVDGIIYHTSTADKLSELTLPEPPVKDGHYFVGWYYDKDVWTLPFKPEELPTESKEKELKYAVHAYFVPSENGGDPMSYLFKLNEITLESTKLLDFSDPALLASNPSAANLITEYDGRAAFHWTPVSSNYSKSFTLPAEANLSTGTLLKFSVYSENATGMTVQVRFNCPADMQGLSSMPPYFRQTFRIDFTGWKDFTFSLANMSGNYSPSWNRIASVSFDCSGWSLVPTPGTNLYVTALTVPASRYEASAPEGVDINAPEHYDYITAKYRELLIGNPNGSTSKEYNDIVNSTAASCGKVWKTNATSFKNTFVDVNTPSTLFGYDMSNRTNQNNVDEQKITSIYNNLLIMARAYATKGDGNPYYHDADLLNDIKLGLEYTYLNYYGPTVWEDGVYGNWWHWDIGVPLSLTGILCVLENELGIDLCKRYLEAFDYLNPLPNMTACNKVWITRCVLLSAALQHDPVRLLRSNAEVYDVFDYVTIGDGFYTDGSFIQHEVLPYTGGYGLSMLNELTNIMYFMSGSRFEWSDPEVANQYRWVFENFRPCIYDGNFMAAMRGREVCRSNTKESAAQSSTVVSLIKMQSYAPAEIKPALEALIRHYMLATGKSYASSVPLCLVDYALALYANESVAPDDGYIVTKVFGNMDRVVQHGPEYGVCIALSSTRMAKYESINRENQTAWYTGDGMIYIYTDGYDYTSDFYNKADPYLMPGVTANSATRLPNCPSPTVMNSNPYAGGVSQGAYGAAGFILGYPDNVKPSKISSNSTKGTFESDEDASISARKSYFMFDNEIVCVGTGITDNSGTDVRTTVENRLMKSGDVFSVNGSAVTPTEAKTDVSASYMHFTGMGGYVFLLNETDKNTISYSKRENASYLEIFISHGVRPSGNGKAYAYVYLPEATAEQTAAYNASPDIKLVRRTNKTHAVAETKLGVLGCNIFDSQGDSFNNNSAVTAVRSISSNKACSIMISTNAEGQTVISVSDPTQLTPTVILDLGINATSVVSADEGVEVALSAGSARITVNTLNAKGATFSVTLK